MSTSLQTGRIYPESNVRVYEEHAGISPPLLFNFVLEYAIRKVQETRLGLDMNGTYQVLAYADDVNLIGDDIRSIKRNAEVLINTCKDIHLTVNTE